MKIALIGVGNVGKSVLMDIISLGVCDEIALVGRNEEKLKAEILDIRDAAVLWDDNVPALSFGGYENTAGADIILYSAGSPKISDDRMKLAHDNFIVAKSIFEEVKKYNCDGIIICISNPLDVITTAAQIYSNRPTSKVIGTGTLLESARLRRLIADILDISSNSVNITVIGEHGNSCVPVLSSCRIMGLTLEEYLKEDIGADTGISVSHIQEAVKNQAFKIYAGKGYTNYGVSASACKLVKAIVNNTREILPVSSVLSGEYSVTGYAVSVPCIIGKDGIVSVRNMKLSENESEAFARSCEIIKSALINEGLPLP